MSEIVYFKAIENYSKTEEINLAVIELFKKVNPGFTGNIAIKVHFGEEGNKTFISPNNYDKLVNYIKLNRGSPAYIETNVLYKSKRTTKESHTQLAREHGFTNLPIIIADGEVGEEFIEVEINKKHFQKCKVGKTYGDFNQLIVISHFKGHGLSGFGGAIKQLGMGFAARAGKLAMHSNSKPIINPLKCKKCHLCEQNCPVNAITIGLIPHIDTKKCIGCAKCISICPHHACTVNWISTLPGTFEEKLCEYAFAATKANKDSQIIYINFLLNITDNCDCMSHTKIVAKDIGILAGTDPVALDKACYDLLNKRENKKVFGGEKTFDYAESIGLGTKEYILKEI
jgi:uncharacterized protein